MQGPAAVLFRWRLEPRSAPPIAFRRFDRLVVTPRGFEAHPNLPTYIRGLQRSDYGVWQLAVELAFRPTLLETDLAAKLRCILHANVQ